MTPEVELNQTKFELIFSKCFFTFWFNQIVDFRIKLNEFWTNPVPENLTPPYNWNQSTESNSNWLSTNILNTFCPFESIESQIFISNRKNFERIPIWLHRLLTFMKSWQLYYQYQFCQKKAQKWNKNRLLAKTDIRILKDLGTACDRISF